MKRIERTGMIALAAAALAGGVAAFAFNPLHQVGAGPASTGEVVRLRALADVKQITPGETFHLVFVFELEPKWHIYWKNPGEGAAPVEIKVDAPPGYSVGPIRWPRPSLIPGPLGDSYGYEHQAVLFVPVTAPGDLAEGEVVFNADLGWAVCWETCRFGTAKKQITVATVIRISGPKVVNSEDPFLAAHLKRLPQSLETLDGSSVEFDGRVLRFSGSAAGHSAVSFFPDSSPGVTCGPATTRIENDRFHIAVDVTLNPNNALGKPMLLGGLAALGMKPDDPCYEFSQPVEPAKGPAVP